MHWCVQILPAGSVDGLPAVFRKIERTLRR